MTIAYIAPWGRQCGLSAYAENMVAALAAAGHTVWVLDENLQDAEGKRADTPNVPVVPLPVGWTQADPGPVCAAVASIRPDAVFLQSNVPAPDVAALRAMAAGCADAGAPLVVQWHTAYGATIGRLMAEIGAAGHVVGHPLAAQGDPCLYLPCPCYRPLMPSARRGPGARIATFGLMYRSKGLDRTVDAFAEFCLRAHGMDPTLDIYSSDNSVTRAECDATLADLDARIRAHGLEGRVAVYRGYLTEERLMRNLNAADAILLLYHAQWDVLSHSAALPFALSAARPVICSDIAHFDGPAGLKAARIPVNGPTEAADALVRLLSRKGEHKAACEAARAYAGAYGFAQGADILADFLLRLSAGRHRAPGLDIGRGVGVVIPASRGRAHVEAAIASARGAAAIVVADTVNASPAKYAWAVSVPAFGARPGEARNIGVAALPRSVKWVQFLDDDDVLARGWLAAVRTGRASNADSVVGCATTPGGLVRGSHPYTSMVSVRRSAFEAVGGFDSTVERAEERDLLARLRGAGFSVHESDAVVCERAADGGSAPHPAEVAKDLPKVAAPAPRVERKALPLKPRTEDA